MGPALILPDAFVQVRQYGVEALNRETDTGASVLCTVIRLILPADYTDPIYARLAKASQKLIRDDPGLQQYTFRQGMTFVCDGLPSRFTDGWDIQFESAKSPSNAEHTVEMSTRGEVYQRIHGKNSQPPSTADLGGKSRWNKAYCNLDAAFIDAKECIQVYYDRCLKLPSITFRCGSAVNHINILDGKSEGVTMEDGSTIKADLVIVAAGAWSNKLVYLGNRIYPIGHEVAWIKVTPEEEARWKNMSITTNMSTGLNLFPPYHGEIKILRRSPGYINTITVAHPEDPSKTLQISHPRTIVNNPTDVIPADAEAAMRENLREIMPPLAHRPFDRTKICWYVTITLDTSPLCKPPNRKSQDKHDTHSRLPGRSSSQHRWHPSRHRRLRARVEVPPHHRRSRRRFDRGNSVSRVGGKVGV